MTNRQPAPCSRRRWLTTAAAAPAALALAACSPGWPAGPWGQPVGGKQRVSKEPVSIRYHLRSGSQGEYFQQQAEAFARAQDGVRVAIELAPGSEYEQKLTAEQAAGTLGDGFWAAPFVAFYPFSARGVARDMRPLAATEKFDLRIFFPGAIEQLTWDGKLTGWPLGAHPGWTSMYTNLDAWKGGGAKPPEWEWTYDRQWLEAVKTATVDRDRDGTPERYGFLFDYVAQGAYTFIKSFGGDWVDPQDGRKSLVSAKPTVDGLMFLHDLVHRHGVSPAQAAIVPNMFAQGQVASWANGIWALSAQATLIGSNFAWQVFPMPAGPGGRGTFIGIDTLCINSASKSPGAVFKWHLWLTTKEAGLAQIDHNFTPPLRQDAWKDPKLANDVNFRAAAKWMEVAKSATFPKNARVGEFGTAFNQGFQAFMREKTASRGLIDELHRSVQIVLDQPLA